MYRKGEGVLQDYKQVMKWSMKAASAGNAEAQYRVGDLYYWGRDVPRDYKQAMNWCLKAANNGNTDAMIYIGLMYHNGFGVTANIPTFFFCINNLLES
jgi:TPR repeat protein